MGELDRQGRRKREDRERGGEEREREREREREESIRGQVGQLDGLPRSKAGGQATTASMRNLRGRARGLAREIERRERGREKVPWGPKLTMASNGTYTTTVKVASFLHLAPSLSHGE